MNKWLAIPGAAAVAASLTLSSPAQAASYTIHGASAAGGYDTLGIFQIRNCDRALAAAAPSGLGGIDSIFVDVTGRSLQTVNARWSMAVTHEILAPHMTVRFFDSRCTQMQIDSATAQSIKPGAWSFQIPSNAKWMVITAKNGGETTITL